MIEKQYPPRGVKVIIDHAPRGILFNEFLFWF